MARMPLKKLIKKTLWIVLIGWTGLVASYYQGGDTMEFSVILNVISCVSKTFHLGS